MSILGDITDSVKRYVGVAGDYTGGKLNDLSAAVSRNTDFLFDETLTEGEVAPRDAGTKVIEFDKNAVYGADGKPQVRQITRVKLDADGNKMKDADGNFIVETVADDSVKAESSHTLSEEQRLDDISTLEAKTGSWKDWIPNAFPNLKQEKGPMAPAYSRRGGVVPKQQGYLHYGGSWEQGTPDMLNTQLSQRIQDKNRQLLGLSKNYE